MIQAEGQHELREALERHLEGPWTWLTLYEHLRGTHRQPSVDITALGQQIRELEGRHGHVHGVKL